MDVTDILQEHAADNATDVLERSTPITVDAGLLAAFDTSPIDAEEYTSNLNPHLLALTLTSTASLISTLFTLPRLPTNPVSGDGPTVSLPAPVTLLPREKPLPKPKPPTKWERFAKAKGITHKNREKRVWDDERQDWVARWGKDGKNRDGEEQWLHEVKAGQGADEDPRATARAERKARISKNEKQAAANASRAANLSSAPDSARSTAKPTVSVSAQNASARSKRKVELDRTLAITKTSTASLGRFDSKIEGEPKVKGVKRKFDANEVPDFAGEKTRQLDVLKRVERGETAKSGGKKGGGGRDGDVNVRKAVRYQGKQERAAGGGGGGGGGGKRRK